MWDFYPVALDRDFSRQIVFNLGLCSDTCMYSKVVLEIVTFSR